MRSRGCYIFENICRFLAEEGKWFITGQVLLRVHIFMLSSKFSHWQSSSKSPNWSGSILFVQFTDKSQCTCKFTLNSNSLVLRSPPQRLGAIGVEKLLTILGLTF